MNAPQFRIAGAALYVDALILCVFAWTKYDESRHAAAAMRENPMMQQLANAAAGLRGSSVFEPSMPEAGKIALCLAAMSVVGAVACFLMASKSRE